MKKTQQVFLLRWLIPGLLLVGFLIIPNILHTLSNSPLASNWIARLFFVLFLVNPFVGAAKIIEKPEILDAENRKYEFYTPDKDSLRLFNMIGTLFMILASALVFYLGIGIYFSIEGVVQIALTALFGTIIGWVKFYVSSFRTDVV